MKKTSIRQQAIARDGCRCQRCGCRDDLSIHHIAPKAFFPELKHELKNLITLCLACHLNLHKSIPIGLMQPDGDYLLGWLGQNVRAG